MKQDDSKTISTPTGQKEGYEKRERETERERERERERRNEKGGIKLNILMHKCKQ